MNHIFNQILSHLKLNDKNNESIDTTSKNQSVDQELSSIETVVKQNLSDKSNDNPFSSYDPEFVSKYTYSDQVTISKKPYKTPPLTLLKDSTFKITDENSYLKEQSAIIQNILQQHHIQGTFTEFTMGPRNILCQLAIAAGTSVIQVKNLKEEIQSALSVSRLEIEAPIPGTSSIGISFPNRYPRQTSFKDVIVLKKDYSSLKYNIGQDYIGNNISIDFNKEPHLLISGTTGSGKSEFLDTIIMSILMKESPENVKLILIDTNYIQFSFYNGIPHLLLPVINDSKKAAGALHWLYKEVSDRLELLQRYGKRNIDSFNEMVENNSAPDVISEEKRVKMPHVFCIIDDYADLVYSGMNEDISDSINNICKIGNLLGIHLIISTQRPVASVINTAIKILFPSRIAFNVASSIDSRLIIDANGAEKLTTHGDFIYKSPFHSKLITGQTAFVSEDEIHSVVNFLNEKTDIADYNSQIETLISKSNDIHDDNNYPNPDPLLKEAGLLVINDQKGSIGYLQRHFRIGFNRAARIMDQLYEAGVVGPEMGTKPREIRMSKKEFLKRF